MKRFLVVPAALLVVAVVVLTTSWSGTASAQTPTPGQVDPAALYQQLLDAANAGDLDATMAFFTDDAVFQNGLGCVDDCVGTAAIRAEFATIVADHTRVTIISSQVSGNTATGEAEGTSDSLRAGGVERIVFSFTLEVRGDKISSLRVVPITEVIRFAAAPPGTGTGGSISGGSVTGWVLAAGALSAVGLLATTAGGLAFARRRRS